VLRLNWVVVLFCFGAMVAHEEETKSMQIQCTLAIYPSIVC
jgi:hypothetical protein